MNRNRELEYIRRPERRIKALEVDTTLSSTSCDLSASTSESEDASLSGTTMEKSRILPTTRKSLSHTSLEDLRSLPLLKTRLGHLWDKKLHTDVIFYVGPSNEEVEAHRVILSSASYIFERLFYDSDQKLLMESDKFIFHEPNYSKASFEVFVKDLGHIVIKLRLDLKHIATKHTLDLGQTALHRRYTMYTNEVPEDLPLPLALEIFFAAKKYQVLFLENLVLAHILRSVSVDTVFEAMKVSTNSLELTNIVPICWKIIEDETPKVLSKHLDHLDEHNFTRILTRDHLNIEEVELFQFLVKWGSVQCKRRGLKTTGKNKRQMIDHMLKYIRFTTINSMDFNDIVIPSRILEPKEIFALQSHISPAHNGESRVNVPYNSRPRFKPRLSLRRPESLTHNISTSSSGEVGDGDVQSLPIKPSSSTNNKLRLKKAPKKIFVGKAEKGSKSHR